VGIIRIEFDYVEGVPHYKEVVVTRGGQRIVFNNSDLLVAWKEATKEVQDDSIVMFSSSCDEFLENSPHYSWGEDDLADIVSRK
jgi:hypothetical protein